MYFQVTLDIVHAETTEEHNTTETAKTYKVNCDKRNITGMEDYTVHVLNVSQVSFQSSCSPWNLLDAYFLSCQPENSTWLKHNLNFRVGFSAYSGLYVTQDLMEFLNANSSECSVVLFFTAWCQFSARLAPHFNALPRVFPSMHFLALDASQHSRWLVCVLVCVCEGKPLVCNDLVETEV